MVNVPFEDVHDPPPLLLLLLLLLLEPPPPLMALIVKVPLVAEEKVRRSILYPTL